MTMTMNVDDDFGELYPDLEICDIKSLRGIGSLYRIIEEDSVPPAPVRTDSTDVEHMSERKEIKAVDKLAEDDAINETEVEAGDSPPCTEVLQADCNYSDSDSEDDIKILLNPIDKSSHVNVTRESEDDEDELVILAGNERTLHQEQVSRSNEDKCIVGDEKGKNTKGTGVLVGAQRSGFGVHPYYRSYRYVRSEGSNTGVVSRGKTRSQKTPRISWGNGVSRLGLEYHLPPNKTVFDIDIESFEEKPWRCPSADISDYFNFGFDEKSWTAYCKQMVLLRSRRLTHKNMINISGRGENSNNDTLPDSLGTSEPSSADISVKVDPHINPIAQAIEVEAGQSERLPSSDTRGRQIRQSNAIYLVDVVDDPSIEKADPEAKPDMDGKLKMTDQSKGDVELKSRGEERKKKYPVPGCKTLSCDGLEKKRSAFSEGPATCRHKVRGPPTPPGKIPTQEERNIDRGESHSSSLNDDSEDARSLLGRPLKHSCSRKILAREKETLRESKCVVMKKRKGVSIKKNSLHKEIGKQSSMMDLNADTIDIEDQRMPNVIKCHKVKLALKDLCSEKHKSCKHKLKMLKKSQCSVVKIQRKSQSSNLISECTQKSKIDASERVLVDGNQGIRNKLVKCFLTKSKNGLRKESKLQKVMLIKDTKHPNAAICNVLETGSMQCHPSGKTLDKCGKLNVSTKVVDKELHPNYCNDMIRRKRSCSSNTMQILGSSKVDDHNMAVSKDEAHSLIVSAELSLQDEVRIKDMYDSSDVNAKKNAGSEPSSLIEKKKNALKAERQLKKQHKKHKCKKQHKCSSEKGDQVVADKSISVQNKIAASENISVQNKQNTNPKTVFSPEFLSEKKEKSSKLRESIDEKVNLEHRQTDSISVLNEFPGKSLYKDEDVMLRHSDSESEFTASEEGSRKRGRSKFERWATHSEVNGSTGNRINLSVKQQSKSVKTSNFTVIEDSNAIDAQTRGKASQHQVPLEIKQPVQGIDELVAKWEKRRERFKLWMADQRDTGTAQREPLEEGAWRPLRKRKWNGGG